MAHPSRILEEAFLRLKDSVTPSDARDFESTTLKDVRKMAIEIEQRLAARNSLRNLRRIEPLLQKLEHYSRPLDILCNGTPFLPWIWAPIKLILQLAHQHVEILEKIIDAYAQIATALPRFDRINRTFPTNAGVSHILSVIYADVLEFHRRAYKFVRQRAWETLFKSAWAAFDARFKSILESLEKHSDWLDREAGSLDIAEAKEWRKRLEETVSKKEKDQLHHNFREALAWLAAEDQEDELGRISDHCQTRTCEWFLKSPKIISWLKESPESTLIWLRGIPGAGKSVLCSQLIKDMKENGLFTTTFYLCNSSMRGQDCCVKMLKSLAAQLLKSHMEIGTYIYNELINRGVKASTSALRNLLKNMHRSSTRIVVDGLDELDENEHKAVIKELSRLVKAAEPLCKILISSREGREISRELRQKPCLSLNDESENIGTSIRHFITCELEQFKNDFREDLLAEAGSSITQKAGGMFLWARLVLLTLKDVHNELELSKAVEALPEGLDGIYSRIMQKVECNLSVNNRRKVMRILQWVAFSKRRLRVQELLDGISLHEDCSFLSEGNRLKRHVLEVCKPILEETPSGLVDLVHFSAKESVSPLSQSSFILDHGC